MIIKCDVSKQVSQYEYQLKIVEIETKRRFTDLELRQIIQENLPGWKLLTVWWG